MESYCGIDVSLGRSSVYVVDAEGSIVREAAVACDPDAPDRPICSSSYPTVRRPSAATDRREPAPGSRLKKRDEQSTPVAEGLFPIKWNHLIDKKMRRNKEIEQGISIACDWDRL